MTLKQLILGLAATFFLPWLILIVIPYGSLAGIQPVAYGEDEETKGFFPGALASTEARGYAAYLGEGCIQCHTQVIRPQYVSGDGDEFKKGWGEDQTSPAPVRTRTTTPYDYIGEPFAAIGTRRHGPDLANAGFRFASRREILEHLYNPRAETPWSTCPSNRHLFTERRILGPKSELGIAVSRRIEAVPGDTALALADYVLALKRTSPLPVILGGRPTPAAPPATAAPAVPGAPATPAPAPAPAVTPAAPAGAAPTVPAPPK